MILFFPFLTLFPCVPIKFGYIRWNRTVITRDITSNLMIHKRRQGFRTIRLPLRRMPKSISPSMYVRLLLRLRLIPITQGRPRLN